MKNGIVIILILLSPLTICAQETQIREMIEKAAETYDIAADDPALAEEIADRTLHPVNLNEATMAELESIPMLSPEQVFHLQEYILQHGTIFSIYELSKIKGFDSLQVQKIEPFVSITPVVDKPRFSAGSLWRNGRHDLLFRREESLPHPVGYRSSDTVSGPVASPQYTGSPVRYQFRYAWKWFDHLRIGIAGEKDPGEQFLRGGQPNGFDHYAGYISLHRLGWLETLTMGHFRAGFGQGLTLGSGMSISNAPGLSHTGTSSGIRPSTGLSESNYLRGVALGLKIRKIKISLIGSSHHRDAAIQAGQDSPDGYFTSFQETGYHRTEAEISKRGTVREIIAGGHLDFTHSPDHRWGFNAGISGFCSNYSVPMAHDDEPYKHFAFSGRQEFVTGVDYQFRCRFLHLFGELSRTAKGYIATVNGVSFTPDPRWTALLIFRHYPPGFINPMGKAFGQLSKNSNETGLFLSCTILPTTSVAVRGYLDLFRCPWLRYRVDAPSTGLEYGISTQWNPRHRVNLSFRLTGKQNALNHSADDMMPLRQINTIVTRTYQVSMGWNISNLLTITSRVDIKEFVSMTTNLSAGYCLSGELRWIPAGLLQSLIFRFSCFDIPGYDTRIYQYEPEVLYGYSVPAYQGRGLRYVSVIKFRLIRSASLWLRGGVSWYSDVTMIGSGADQTAGNLRVDLSAQIQVKF